MAKQSGIIKLEGTIGDLTFYKSQDGMLARMKGGVSGDKIKSDPAFARTRENGAEFGRAGSAGKLLRLAFRTFIQNVSDSKMVSRLTKEMVGVVKADATSTRGLRNVLDGELELLEGFDFNINCEFAHTMCSTYEASIDRATGICRLSIPELVPLDDIKAPEGASHVRFVIGGASIDFENEKIELKTYRGAEILVNSLVQQVVDMSVQLGANSTHPLFLVAGVEFYQAVNGENYPLKNGQFNSLMLVKVVGI